MEVIASNLKACGVKAVVEGTDLVVTGSPTFPVGGVSISACHDHRIAMSFLILGSLTQSSISVTGAETIATSFPNFIESMRGLGMDISEEKHIFV